jgi:hypothetical protein
MLIDIVLLLTIVIIAVNATISSTTIEADVNELGKLRKEFIDLSSNTPAREYYEGRCRMINECCPSEQQNSFNLFTLNQVYDKCLQKGKVLKKMSSPSSCNTTIFQVVQITKDPYYKRYKAIFSANATRVHTDFKQSIQMKLYCSTDECNAFYCQRNNIQMFKSCQQKLLQVLAATSKKDNGIEYNKYISELKQQYTTDNVNLAKAFPKV